MKQQRVVVALGGNAFAEHGREPTMAGQFRFAQEALATLNALWTSQWSVVLVHGNGPQVGHMLVRVEEALGKAYSLPLEVCVAESEGELGYVLAQSLRNLFAEQNLRRPIASLLTQVLVDGDDPGFKHPTKPIGPFYRKEQAEELRARGYQLIEDAGRGYRRVVPSPQPKAIVETEVIRVLLDAGAVVIAAGGGGVPVLEHQGHLQGVDAVVDKDLTAALLGKTIDAELLLILTAVPFAYLHYRTHAEEPLRRATPERARALLAEGHFGEGSMAPKIEAAARFVEETNGRAIITTPAQVAAALEGNAGTIIERETP